MGSEMIMSTFSGKSISSIFPEMTWMQESTRLDLTKDSACLAMLEPSTAYTFLAPACWAKKLKIPDPAPTSSTTLSRKSADLEETIHDFRV